MIWWTKIQYHQKLAYYQDKFHCTDKVVANYSHIARNFSYSKIWIEKQTDVGYNYANQLVFG